ncbi:MAG TPA: arylsulfotransferase family protein [Thermoanaerobaculia bacterium]|nr:arylsulfotransferase family protein [Thermoanaerobaculia bacterium]
MRKLLRVLALAAALAAALLYGFAARGNRWFPYQPLKAVYQSLWPHQGHSFRWNRLAVGTTGLAQRDAVGALMQLPYLRGSNPATAVGGVRIYDAARASPGWNLFLSGHAPEARLTDMSGLLRHRWALSIDRVWPGLKKDPDVRDYDKFWRRAVLLPDGDLLVVWENIGIMRVDSRSRLKWANLCGANHDIAVDGEGLIYVLTRQKKILPDINQYDPVFEDFVTTLTPDGRIVRSISLLRAFEKSDYAPELAAMKSEGDLFHSNAIQVFDGTLASRSPHFRRGNILVSIHSLGVVGILDPESQKIVWALSGQWRAQHATRLLDSGRILLFDNFGSMRVGESRVLEVDPLTQEISWRYGEGETERFFSGVNGFVQRLGNGNTLISVSAEGRAIEVTPGKEIVWEFDNPFRAGEENELVPTLYQAVRLPPDLPVTQWAAEHPPN